MAPLAYAYGRSVYPPEHGPRGGPLRLVPVRLHRQGTRSLRGGRGGPDFPGASPMCSADFTPRWAGEANAFSLRAAPWRVTWPPTADAGLATRVVQAYYSRPTGNARMGAEHEVSRVVCVWRSW